MSAPNSGFILDAEGSLYEQLDTDLTSTVLDLDMRIDPNLPDRPFVRYAAELGVIKTHEQESHHLHQAFCVGILAVLDAFAKSDLKDCQKLEMRKLFVVANTGNKLFAIAEPKREQVTKATFLRGLKAHPEIGPIAQLLNKHYTWRYRLPDTVNPIYTGIGLAAATLDDCYETVMRAQTEEAFGVNLDEIGWETLLG